MAGIYVIPRAGLKVRNPENGDHLPAAGALVSDNSYWRRRLRDGDVTLGQAEAAKPAAKAKKE